MNAHVRDCLVTGYEPLIPQLHLPDANDRHVLAAAIACGASTIVTFNIADFPASVLAGHRISAEHPDDFLLRLLRGQPDDVCSAIRRQRASLKNPPQTADQLLAVFQQQRLTQLVAELRTMISDL